MRKFLSILITICLSLTLLPTTVCAANNGIKVGDYITLGTYYGQPIKWRCIDIDKNGPLMLSDKVLCLKAFDASGKSTLHQSVREYYGSNCWKESNLREWLNSNEQTVQWSHVSPSSTNVLNGYNAYDEEAGFLTGFTEAELACIKPVTQKVYTNQLEHDRGVTDGGTEEYCLKDGHVADQNFDLSKGYYQNVTDRFFLLNILQLKALCDNLGEDYLKAYPTEEAVKNSNFSNNSFATDSGCPYWIGHAGNLGLSYEHVFAIQADGLIGGTKVWEYNDHHGAYTSTIGVRPAFYFNAEVAMSHGFDPELDGWNIGNIWMSFYETEDYHIPVKRYTETFGWNLSSLFQMIASIPKWGGSCFGMSLSSVANYEGKINLAPYFEREGSYLNEYGYDVIKQLNDKNYFALEDNSDVTAMIERMQLSQKSENIKEALVFQNDDHYVQLLKYLQGDSPQPLIVGMAGQHAVVIETSQKPAEIKSNPGWYLVPLYDPNAPYPNSQLSNPVKWYSYSAGTYLMLDTNTGNWKYVHDNQVEYSMTHDFLGLSNIDFFDISKLNDDFFTKSLSLWGTLVKIEFSASNFSIQSSSGDTLFELKDGKIVSLSEISEYRPVYSEEDIDIVGENNVCHGILEIPCQSFTYTADSADVTIWNPQCIFGISNAGTTNITVDIPNSQCSFSPDNPDNKADIKAVLQVSQSDENYQAVGVCTSLDSETMNISAKDCSNTTVSSTDPFASADIYVDNSKNDPKQFHDVAIKNLDHIEIEDQQLAFVEPKQVSSITLNASEKSCIVSDSFMLTADVLPEDADDKSVCWSSSDPSVAQVNENGLVTAIGVGNAVVTALNQTSGVSACCNITVSAISNDEKSSSDSVDIYSISVKQSKYGNVTANRKYASKGTVVTLTIDPSKGYALENLTVLDKNGNEIRLAEKNGKYTFTMPASKVTVEASFMEDNSMLNFFVDVPADAYYYDAVLWAAEEGITGGTSATTFSPNATCTRAQAVTFLWRAAGSPAPKSSAMPFTDVTADAYYHDAVLWAVEKGITKGTSETAFSPNATCTRAQIVTFVWRSQKSPAADTVNPFTDVAAEAYYNSAVLWAVENGITAGTTATTFSPNNDCTRAQIVTFLFRAEQ